MHAYYLYVCRELLLNVNYFVVFVSLSVFSLFFVKRISKYVVINELRIQLDYSISFLFTWVLRPIFTCSLLFHPVNAMNANSTGLLIKQPFECCLGTSESEMRVLPFK